MKKIELKYEFEGQNKLLLLNKDLYELLSSNIKLISTVMTINYNLDWFAANKKPRSNSSFLKFRILTEEELKVEEFINKYNHDLQFNDKFKDMIK